MVSEAWLWNGSAAILKIENSLYGRMAKPPDKQILVQAFPGICLRAITFDSNIQISGKDPKQLSETLTKELEHVIDWFTANKLLLNVNKTKIIVFRSHKFNKDIDSFPVAIDNEILSRVEYERDLLRPGSG
jgi:hypothetical protein